MGREFDRHGEKRNAFKVWERKLQARKSLGRRRLKFENKYYSLTHGAEPFLRSCQLCSY
jgi:hypothetical protein